MSTRVWLSAIALLAPLTTAAADPADGRFLAAEALVAVASKSGVVADPSSPRWDAVPPTRVWLVPQHTMVLTDGDANAALTAAKAKSALVRATYDAQSLAVALEWPDATESRGAGGDPSAFGDAAALELPEAFGAGKRLPYVGMGDAGAPVRLSMVRARDGGVDTRAMVAAGFGSSTRTGAPVFEANLRYDARAQRWRAVFVMPLVGDSGDLRRGLVPIAFAAWDGEARERGGNKALSRWRFLRLGDYPLDPNYLTELRYGYAAADQGDPARGKMLAGAVCALCHRFADKQLAPVGVAPDLGVIGAIASPKYLMSSLTDPNEVLVPSPNPNQHYQAGKLDASGAHPNEPRFRWAQPDPTGKWVSPMPSFATMAPADLAAIVAYLRTLTPPEMEPR